MEQLQIMLPSIFIIPSEFLFLIEIIKAYYYISYYFFMYFETLTHSAGLTNWIDHRSAAVFSFFLLVLYDCLRESLNILNI